MPKMEKSVFSPHVPGKFVGHIGQITEINYNSPLYGLKEKFRIPVHASHERVVQGNSVKSVPVSGPGFHGAILVSRVFGGKRSGARQLIEKLLSPKQIEYWLDDLAGDTERLENLEIAYSVTEETSNDGTVRDTITLEGLTDFGMIEAAKRFSNNDAEYAVTNDNPLDLFSND